MKLKKRLFERNKEVKKYMVWCVLVVRLRTSHLSLAQGKTMQGSNVTVYCQKQFLNVTNDKKKLNLKKLQKTKLTKKHVG